MKTMRKSERLGTTEADTYQGKHCLVSAGLVSASSHWKRAVWKAHPSQPYEIYQALFFTT